MSIQIAPLEEADTLQVEALLDAAFGHDRRTRTAYRIREGMTPLADLSFGAFAGNLIVGSIQCWPVALDDEPLVLVGPVAVLPEFQRSGVGKILMKKMLAKADAASSPPQVMIGDHEYYGRFFGFSAEATGGWVVPGPVERRRLLARAHHRLPLIGTLGPRNHALARSDA